MGAWTLPDYAGGSIVNLMASLAAACGRNASGQGPAHLLASVDLAHSPNLALVVMDGLGHGYLQQNPMSFLGRHCIGSLTSVFPSTTAAAITTFFTGLAPAQHGATGWHCYYPELGCVFTPLPGRRRDGRELDHSLLGNVTEKLFGPDRIYPHMHREVHVVAPHTICHSAFNSYFCQGAYVHGYLTLDDFFDLLAALCRREGGSKFIYAYYPEHDSLCHMHGVGSSIVMDHFKDIDRGVARLADEMSGTLLVCTADHGLIDNPVSHALELSDWPALASCLRLPLCGEPRVAYCYLKEDQADRFEAIVANLLGDYARCFLSSEALKAGLFGPSPAASRTRERIGDFMLIMRDDWTIKDWLPGEKRYRQRAVHGGFSQEEMLVPLIVLER